MQDFFQTFWDTLFDNKNRLLFIFFFNLITSYFVIPRLEKFIKISFLLISDLLTTNINLIKDSHFTFLKNRTLKTSLRQRLKNIIQSRRVTSEYTHNMAIRYLFIEKFNKNQELTSEQRDAIWNVIRNNTIKKALNYYNSWLELIQHEEFYSIYKYKRFIDFKQTTKNHLRTRTTELVAESLLKIRIKLLRICFTEYIKKERLPLQLYIYCYYLKLRFSGFLLKRKIFWNTLIAHNESNFNNYSSIKQLPRIRDEIRRIEPFIKGSTHEIEHHDLYPTLQLQRLGDANDKTGFLEEWSKLITPLYYDEYSEDSWQAYELIEAFYEKKVRPTIIWFLEWHEKKKLIDLGYKDDLMQIQSSNYKANEINPLDDLNDFFLERAPLEYYFNAKHKRMEYSYDYLVINKNNFYILYDYYEHHHEYLYEDYFTDSSWPDDTTDIDYSRCDFLKDKFYVETDKLGCKEEDDALLVDTLDNLKSLIESLLSELSAIYYPFYLDSVNAKFSKNVQETFTFFLSPILAILFFLFSFVIESIYLELVTNLINQYYTPIVTILNLVL